MGDLTDRIENLSPLKRALLTLDELQIKIDRLEKEKKEPIAIIGMACQFPGAENIDAYWQLLRSGSDAITEVPKDRWDIDQFYDPTPGIPGKMVTKWGGFIKGIEQFDPQFFGISPREALSIDPQHRLILQTTWHAFEDAGIVPDHISGSKSGVFMGISTNDYTSLSKNDPILADAYSGVGNAYSIAANRVSYQFDLRGPSVAIDTACSSSLVAIHLAVQSLRKGESNLAIAGGVNLIISPLVNIIFSQARMMAADGRCKTFDASADGYVRGEGCGIVILKRLSEAIKDKDKILAVIYGSAVNQDGKSNGLTAPNGLAQQQVIREAMKDAGTKSEDIDYIEAHGTGTSLGDPIEMRSIANVLKDRTIDNPVIVGSVKTNIGHLEAAAGIAGVIKVVLSLAHQEIPPHLHFKQINPFIPLDEMPVRIPVERISWQRNNKKRYSGISSFGFGGTNTHIIIGDPPIQEENSYQNEDLFRLFTFSSKDEDGLINIARNMKDYFDKNPDINLADLSHTLNSHRSHLPRRIGIISDELENLKQSLSSFLANEPDPNLHISQSENMDRPKIAFLFTGQGAQYNGMGRVLFDSLPLFRSILEDCEKILIPVLEKPLLSVIFPDDASSTLIDETVYTQPALFAIEYALAKIWLSWGIVPDYLLGHSIGEYVAAAVAGVMSMEDGLQLVAKRAQLMQALPDNGEMAVVFSDIAHVRKEVENFNNLVSIAAVNGPNNIVISGEREAVHTIIDRLNKEGINSRYLKVSHAFHSPLMDPILSKFEEYANQFTYNQPQIPIVSNVSGRVFSTEEIPDAKYWRNHIRSTVEFEKSVISLAESKIDWFIEMGPNPTLSSMGKRCLPSDDENSDIKALWLPSLRKEHNDWEIILNSLGEVYVNDLNLDLLKIGESIGSHNNLIKLPNYPFRKERYWLDVSGDQNLIQESFVRDGFEKPGSSLIGRRISSPLPQKQYESWINPTRMPYLFGMRINDVPVLSPNSVIRMAFEAGIEEEGTSFSQVSSLSFSNPVPLRNQESLKVQLILSPDNVSGRYSFEIFQNGKSDINLDHEWKLLGQGKLGRADNPGVTTKKLDLKDLKAKCTKKVDLLGFIEHSFDRVGFGIDLDSYKNGSKEKLMPEYPNAWLGENAILFNLVTQSPQDENSDLLSWDFLVWDLGIMLVNGLIGNIIDETEAAIPYQLTMLDLAESSASYQDQIWGYIEISGHDEDLLKVSCNFLVFDDDGNVILRLEGMQFERIEEAIIIEFSNFKQISQPEEYDPSIEDTLVDSIRTPSYPKVTAEEILLAEASMRAPLIEIFLINQLAKVLKLEAARIPIQQPINYLGLDSIMAIELKNNIEKQMGIGLPITLLLKGPNLKELSLDINDLVEKRFIVEEDNIGLPKSIGDDNPTGAGDYPITPGQRAMWFQHQMDPASVFNPVQAVRIKSEIDPAAIKDAFQILVNNHPALRTTFITRDSEIYQRVEEHSEVFFSHEDLSGNSQEEIKERLIDEAHLTFDLVNGPLIRVYLFETSMDYILMICAHHLVVDLWSLAILIYELTQILNSQVNEPIELSESIKFSDFVNWQAEMLESEMGQKHWEYWSKKLAGSLPVLDLPTDRTRPAIQTHSGGTRTIWIDEILSDKLNSLSEQLGVTLYMTLLAAFKVLLFRYSSQEDIIIGTPTTGRSKPEFMNVVGYFVNPVPIRSHIFEETKFEDYLIQIQKTVVEAIDHQDYPMAMLAERLNPERDSSILPIFQVMFVFQRSHLLYEEGLSQFAVGMDGMQMNLAGMKLESITVDQKFSPFDLTMTMARSEKGLGASLTYNSSLFDPETIDRMLGHFKNLLAGIVLHPEEKIIHLPFITEPETHQLLIDWNNTQDDNPLEYCIHQWFENQVKETPNNIAVKFEGKSLTYNELNRKANQLANYLIKRGIRPENIIGVYLERSIEMIVGILAILKAGGAYLPLDPVHPFDRLAFMLQDAMIPILLTESKFMERLPTLIAQPVFMDTYWGFISQESTENPNVEVKPDNLSYVIYTSGSTGRSKGVLLQHRGLANLVNCQIQGFEVNRQSKVLQFASIGFDASVSEIFMALLSGAALILARREQLISVPDLYKLLQKERITTVTLPPSLLSILPSEGLSNLHTIISAGESCSREIVEKWSPGRKFINAYGPTEATIGPTYASIESLPEQMNNIPIGKPIANTQIFILDKYRQVLPIGIPGEIHVGGVGLAREYINRPELTNEQFVENPFYELLKQNQQKWASPRIYRTGDLGRYLPDGNIEFLGRVDFQVKIRGFRIELGEIESVLAHHPSIKQVIVIDREDIPGEKRLVAYYVVNDDLSVKPGELRNVLRKKVPDYMIPAAFVLMDSLPLNASGKVDRNLLPPPTVDRSELDTSYISPQTELERTIASVWQDVLKIDKVGLNDNFFDLGGHSLLMARVHIQLQEKLDLSLSMINLFRYPTINSLAEFINSGDDSSKVIQESLERADKQKVALKRQVNRMREISKNRLRSNR